MPTPTARHRWALLLAALLAATPLAGCSSAHDDPLAVATGPPPPDLVVVLLREGRGDRPGERCASRLEAPLGTGSTFEAAYATSLHRFTSFGSFLTGLQPTAIPLCSLPPRDGAVPWCTHLPRGRHTLPDLLRARGYRSALLHADPDLERLGRDFDAVVGLEVAPQAPPDQAWAEAAAVAARWWRSVAAPRLLVVEVPLVLGEFHRALAAPERGPSFAERVAAMAAHPELRGRLGPDDPWPFLSPARRRALVTSMERACGAAGSGVAALLGSLPSTRRAVVVTALRGFSLAEPGGTDTPEQVGPGSHRVVTDFTARVPLWMGGEGVPTGTVREPVDIADLLPTLLGLAGLRAPADVPGQDLRGSTDGVAVTGWGDMLALREGRWWLGFRVQIHGATSLDPRITEALLDPGTHGGVLRLYDLAADPGMRRDLAQEDPERLARLHARLVARRTGPDAPPGRLLERWRRATLRERREPDYW